MRYAPLLIHSFALCAPRKILEAPMFNQRYRRYEDIQNVPDRLRWLRHSRGLLQVEAAKIAGGAGGGKPDSAMAGAKDASKLPQVMQQSAEILQNMLK